MAIADDISRPWIKSYPSDIGWDAPVSTTPVHEQVLSTCARMPDSVALDFLGKKTSYGELAKAINTFAGALQSQFGITKGSRVALLLPNTPFYAIAYYGVLRAGGTVVNCNPLYTVAELTHIVGNSGTDVVVTLDLKQMLEKAETLVEAGHIKSLIVCHFPDALPGLKSLLYRVAKRKDLGDLKTSKVRDRITRFADLMHRNDTPAPVSIDPANDVAVQQYTGGTTGIPRGAMLSHANIAANANQARVWFARVFVPGSRGIAVLPFFHIFAMTTCLNVPLSSGMTMFLMPRFELKAFIDLLQRSGATLLPAVPTLISALVRSAAATPEILSGLDVVVSGGASLPNEVRTEFARKSKAQLIEGYGLTEASPVVCAGPLDGLNKPLSIGLPFPATDIRLFDVDRNEVAAIGERGEVQVKGPQVMLGYYDNPEATKDAFMDGWLRTGDVAYMDADGYVFLVDRIKDLIICSGFNVYPRTIEEALSQHPAVEENNVIGVPDEYRGEAPVAFVKLREGKTATAAELKKYLADKLNKIENAGNHLLEIINAILDLSKIEAGKFQLDGSATFFL